MNMRWDAPAHMVIDVGIAPRGKPRENEMNSSTDDRKEIEACIQKYFDGIAQHSSTLKVDGQWLITSKATYGEPA